MKKRSIYFSFMMRNEKMAVLRYASFIILMYQFFCLSLLGLLSTGFSCLGLTGLVMGLCGILSLLPGLVEGGLVMGLVTGGLVIGVGVVAGGLLKPGLLAGLPGKLLLPSPGLVITGFVTGLCGILFPLPGLVMGLVTRGRFTTGLPLLSKFGKRLLTEGAFG
jgi:hypothetical protein